MQAGAKFIYPNTTANKPHVFGFTTARSSANDTLVEIWNGSDNTARRLTLDLNGALKLYGTNSSLLLVDGIAAPSTVAGYGVIFIDTADGDLKIKYGDGTLKVIVADT